MDSGRTLVRVAVLSAVAILSDMAAAQPARAVDTPVLGMTGWRGDPPRKVDTATLGMTGWRGDTAKVDTATLGMTGWRGSDRGTVDTAVLGMTGWRSGPPWVRPLAATRRQP